MAQPSEVIPPGEVRQMTLQSGRVVLLTGDDVIASQVNAHLDRDGIRVTRTSSAGDTWTAITRTQPHALVVDLSTRSIDGENLLSLSVRATRAGIPFLLLSKQQARRDLVGFAAVLRARDVLCRAESMPAVAARIRMWVAATQAELGQPQTGFSLVSA